MPLAEVVEEEEMSMKRDLGPGNASCYLTCRAGRCQGRLHGVLSSI